MADILLFNALKDVEAAIKVNGGLAIDAATIRTAVDSAINAVDYSIVTTQQFNLNRLSCINEISTCTKNFSGSGSGGTVGGSAWNDLQNYNTETLFVKIIAAPALNAISKRITDLQSTVLQNNIKQYIEAYAKNAIDKKIASAANQIIATNIGTYWFRSDTIGAGYSNSLKVCAVDYNVGAGATCTWVVPVGVTQAKFQVWGAGSGTNPGCCCGGSSFGGNGAYSELTIGVTAGDSYSICAGCSCSMCCCSSSAPGYACMSGVTGNGICCLKADGASYCNSTAFNYTTMATVGGCCCRFQNPYCTTSGSCWCSYGEYCGGSCATCGIMPIHPDCTNSRTWCACGTATKEIYKNGFNPLHGGGCLDSNLYGYHLRPPALDSDTCKAYTGGCVCATFTSESCHGGYLGASWTRHPGMGGASTHVMGGANSHYGQPGAGGMVKVSWK